VLTRIQGQAGQASTVVLDIDEATREQAARFEAIEKSATSVADVTSAAAASAEETAAASSEMASQAGTLSELVSRFQLTSAVSSTTTRRGAGRRAAGSRAEPSVPTGRELDEYLVM
jgi:methyl-accepting chemotaxis protein